MHNIPTLADIQAAHDLIRPHIHRTPVLSSASLNKWAGADIYFKCENMQKVGAFKMRGASNAVFSLTADEMEKGVATHSSGNHAGALSLAARLRGIKAYVVMPENAPKVKVEAVRDFGAEITFCEPTLEAREATLQKVVERTGATFIHPFNNYTIIAGQATATVELLDQTEGLQAIIAPVGGGGLLSGTALAAKYLREQLPVFGAEPLQADDAYRSFHAGHIIPVVAPDTVADGLRTSLSEKTFTIISQYVDEIITVTEQEIIDAMRMIWMRLKVLVEPSSAVVLAAIKNSPQIFQTKRVGAIISGGNVDLDKLPWSE